MANAGGLPTSGVRGINELMEKLQPPDIPKGWKPDLWQVVWSIATKMSHEELMLFRLAMVAEESSSFRRVLAEVLRMPRAELMDLLDEMTPEDTRRLLRDYSHYLVD